MDVTFVVTRLNEDLSALIDERDFEGAEEMLSSALGSFPELSAYVHYQFGRLYIRWNKLSSAIHHLHYAIEAAQARGENLFVMQILEELNTAKRLQQSQRP